MAAMEVLVYAAPRKHVWTPCFEVIHVQRHSRECPTLLIGQDGVSLIENTVAVTAVIAAKVCCQGLLSRFWQVGLGERPRIATVGGRDCVPHYSQYLNMAIETWLSYI